MRREIFLSGDMRGTFASACIPERAVTVGEDGRTLRTGLSGASGSRTVGSICMKAKKSREFAHS